MRGKERGNAQVDECDDAKPSNALGYEDVVARRQAKDVVEACETQGVRIVSYFDEECPVLLKKRMFKINKRGYQKDPFFCSGDYYKSSLSAEDEPSQMLLKLKSVLPEVCDGRLSCGDVS